jgi:adenosylcobinamide-GDP ribazoletransferase
VFENTFLLRVLTPMPTALLTVLTLVIVSGGLHIDGLADCADALGAGSDRARALSIMRDSRIGAFGVVAIFFSLAIKTACLAAAGRRAPTALFLAPGLGRWAMVAVGFRMDYLRANGAGAMLLARRDRETIGASLIALVGIISVISFRVLVVSAAALVLALSLRSLYSRWLAGVTGDTLGAAGEIVETVIFVMMSIRLPII